MSLGARLIVTAAASFHNSASVKPRQILETESIMNTLQHCKTAVAIALMCVASGSFAATITKVDYSAGKDRIKAEYKADKEACNKSTANAKDICVEQAKGKEKVALAELQYSYSGKVKDSNKVAVAMADSTYSVAKEMCDDKAGQAKTLCRTEAKATHTKAIADAKLQKKVAAATTTAIEDKTDANYKVALEKCDSMTGGPKTTCVNAAKVRFNKT